MFVLCTSLVGCGSKSPAAPSNPNPPAPPPQAPQTQNTRIVGLSGSLSFGDVMLGESASRDLTISNSGNAALTVSGLVLPTGYTASWTSGTIASNGAQGVTVRFAPGAVGRFSGRVIVNGDHTGGTNAIDITGDGVIPGGRNSGVISDLEVAQDIIGQNQDSGSAPFWKKNGFTARWQLPLPVYLSPDINRDYAIRALEYLRANAGISYVLVPQNADPRVVIRSGTDGLGPQSGARGMIEAGFSNNRARRGLIVIRPDNVPCVEAPGVDCVNIYRHELFHVLGIFGHISYAFGTSSNYPARELALLRTLYALPVGAKVQPDGAWQVGLQ